MTSAETPTARFGREQYVSLTTFRRSGEAVATPVWIAQHGDDLVVTTGLTTGKVKRLRNDPRVLLRPSSRSGEVDPGAETVAGTATIVQDAAGMAAPGDALQKKYGFLYRAIGWARTLRGSKDTSCMLRITLDA